MERYLVKVKKGEELIKRQELEATGCKVIFNSVSNPNYSILIAEISQELLDKAGTIKDIEIFPDIKFEPMI